MSIFALNLVRREKLLDSMQKQSFVGSYKKRKISDLYAF